MTPEQLDAIEQRANQATQGPWVALGNDVAAEVKTCTCYGGQAPYGHEQFCGLDGPLITGAAPQNATFISSARTDVPQLVAEVRRLQTFHDHEKGRADELEAQIEAVEKLHRPSTEKVDGAGVTYRMCLHCTYINRYGQQRYPCPTIQALEGESL